MIIMAAFLFWFFKQKQWIMSNNHHDGEELKGKKDSSKSG
jgi:hypothetical protein